MWNPFRLSIGNEVCALLYRVISEFFVRLSSNFGDDTDEIDIFYTFQWIDESKSHTVLDVNHISHLIFVPNK